MPPDFAALCLTKFPPLARVIIVLCGAVIIHLTIGTYHTYGSHFIYSFVLLNGFLTIKKNVGRKVKTHEKLSKRDVFFFLFHFFSS